MVLPSSHRSPNSMNERRSRVGWLFCWWLSWLFYFVAVLAFSCSWLSWLFCGWLSWKAWLENSGGCPGKRKLWLEERLWLSGKTSWLSWKTLIVAVRENWKNWKKDCGCPGKLLKNYCPEKLLKNYGGCPE